MLGTIVDYLRNAHVSFKLASYASEEARPLAAHHLPAGAMTVEARPFVVDGRSVLLVVPAGEVVDLPGISTALGGVAVPATNAELPGDLGRAEGPVPPLGQLFGLPIVLDERVTRATIVVFRVFTESVYFEMPYDDWARLEQPRIASFARAGELGAGAPPR